MACGASAAPAASTSTCEGRVALVAASDYSSSGVGALPLDGTRGDELTFGAVLGKDPALAISSGRAFYVARDVGHVLEIAPRCGRPISDHSVNDAAHAGSANPQDVAAAPDGALWVPRYNLPSLAVLHGDDIGAIDLSGFDDDGNPQASSIAIVDVGGAPKAFVTLERLDDKDLLSRRASWMLRLDVATRAVESTVPLVGRNPFGSMQQAAGALWLAEPGDFDAADEATAGIERFDAASGASRLLVRETAFGGSVVEVAVVDGCGAAIVADARTGINATTLATFDPGTGAVLERAVLGPSASFDAGLRGLAWVDDGRALLVGDRARAERGYPVHRFERDGACALHLAPDTLLIGQKPISVRRAR